MTNSNRTDGFASRFDGRRRFFSRACFFLLPAFAAGGFGVLRAQAPKDRIEDVLIVGNRRIPESTVLYYVQTQPNSPYDEGQILRDYRSLLGTNFFEDATVKVRQGETGVIVIFQVKERPLVRAIEYEGMKSFKESDVLEKFRDMRVNLTIDSPFDPARLPKARRAIKLLLDLNGRPLGRVEVGTEQITSSSVKLIFTIDEGPKVRIGNIRFEGNTVFKDKQLRKALELNKERGMISLFKGQDKYIKDKLEYDVQVNLLAKYRERGYIQAQAAEPKVEIVEAGRGFLLGFRKTKQQYYITVPIEEGAQFSYGNFEVEGVKTFNQEAVKAAYNVHSGDIVNYTALKQANEDLKKLYASRGYLDMEAIPDFKADPKTRTVDIKINVEEGRLYIVHRITFRGNTKTRDKVLRREFFLEEQQPFNGRLLDVSILRLNQLGFFEKIEEKDYDVIKRPKEGEADVVVKVKERSQQSIGLTGGVSGISGSFFGINYSTNNFRGLGQRIQVQLTTGTRTSSYSFSYTDPYFRDTKMSMGFSVFNQRLRFDTFAASFGAIRPQDSVRLFTQVNTGFEVSGSYPLGRWLRTGLSYNFTSISIEDINSVIEDLALRQLVGFTPGGDPESAKEGIHRSQVTPSIIYNTKNAVFGATRGTRLFVQAPIAGGLFGGNLNLIRPSIEYQRFMPDRLLSGGRNTFAFRAQFNHVLSYGKSSDGNPLPVPFFERIFSGGEFSLRGFDIRSITPFAISRSARVDSKGNPVIDPNTGLPQVAESLVPVGGDTSIVLTGEYRVPVVGPLQVNAFVDVGTSTVLRTSNLQLFGPDTFVELLGNTNNVWRASTGAEVQFLLPVVNQPFRLIFAYNPLALDTDIVLLGRRFKIEEDRRNIKFTVGYTF
ncbi:MAG: outer membrane protein assembly factor BamA [Acidobacteriota bacterium]